MAMCVAVVGSIGDDGDYSRGFGAPGFFERPTGKGDFRGTGRFDPTCHRYPGHPPPEPAFCLYLASWGRHGSPFFRWKERCVQKHLVPFQRALFIQCV